MDWKMINSGIETFFRGIWGFICLHSRYPAVMAVAWLTFLIIGAQYSVTLAQLLSNVLYGVAFAVIMVMAVRYVVIGKKGKKK